MNTETQTPANFKNAVGTRRAFHSQSGQSLVELALLTPLLLLMIIGVVEMGRYAYFSILVGNAAEAGAAYGAQSLGNSNDAIGIPAAAQDDYQNGSALGGLAVTYADVCGCDSGGTLTPDANGCNGPGTGSSSCATGTHWVVTVQVTATGAFKSLFSWPGIPAKLTVVRTVTMVVKPV
jgi:Flp pilus assembly protein TadG